jgi:LPS-assembly protein
LYFPKFFHPDPTVERQSGFLQPRLNNSNVLGSSITTPYFHVLTENQDVTLKPTLFDQDIQMLQAEYRQENKKSSFIGDFSFVNNFKSSISETKNSITHLFSKFFIDLDLESFKKSKAEIYFEKVSNDSYLNIFDSILLETPLKPVNPDKLTSGFNLYLNNNNFNLDLGLTVYENLGLSNSDRYQYVLPFYNFSRNLYSGNFGSINLLSNGSNDLNSTNIIDSYVVNNLEYFSSNNILENFGLVSNFEIYLKNINSIGKKSDKYKSKPKIEMSNLYVFNTSIPLMKSTLNETQILTPKLSFRINPSDMLNYKSEDRKINNSNIFAPNRLGLNDTYEGGKSLTVGVDFNSKKIENENNYYNLNLATVLRDSEEQNIPNSSTLNNKNSNLFGTMEYNFSEFMNLNYAFSLDNNFNTFESNNIGLDFKFNNFGTSINFIEESGNIGNTNILENSFFYEMNENNSLNFKTRRNRTINLTEYYDLVYEYNNDCLTAAMKYKKTYYQNNAIKPTEDLMFTLTIYPITTLEQKVDSNLYRN